MRCEDVGCGSESGFLIGSAPDNAAVQKSLFLEGQPGSSLVKRGLKTGGGAS